jgi:hypothetical protein
MDNVQNFESYIVLTNFQTFSENLPLVISYLPVVSFSSESSKL